jgi:hypothetical protein
MKANKKGKILIRYREIDREKYPHLPYEHDQKMAYTKKNLADIIETVLSNSHTIMIRPYTVLGLTTDTDHITVYIGTGRMT